VRGLKQELGGEKLRGREFGELIKLTHSGPEEFRVSSIFNSYIGYAIVTDRFRVLSLPHTALVVIPLFSKRAPNVARRTLN
jgi:hypothetical protein